MPDQAADRPSFLSRFLRDRRGSVAVTGAVALPVLLGMAALALEYGSALQARVEAQRVADLASYAGAVAYGQNRNEGEMTRAAQSIAALNGIPPEDVAVALEASPVAQGAQAVRATVTAERPLLLARVLGASRALELRVTALAGTAAAEPACIIALAAGSTGVTLSGGTSLTAADCAVASNSSVTAPCGTSITTPAVTYDSAAAPTQCSNIRRADGSASDISRAATPDPVAGHAALAAANARLAVAAALAAPAAPSVATGPNIDFGWNETSTKTQAQAAGCSATKSGSTWTLVCSGQTSYSFGSITIGGGLTLRFNPTGSARTVYNFSGAIRNDGGSVMQFPAGVYNVAGGIVSQGGATTRFGAGTFRVGIATANCGSSGARYSLCNQSILSFEGPSAFDLSGGLYNGGGAQLALGGGTGNAFRIGPSSGGDALFLGGGSLTTLADATGATGAFALAGNLRGGGGGSCLTIPAAAQHDIRGQVVAAGGIVFGAGPYAVDGYMHFGRDGGGGSTCNGATVSVWAEDASFALSGRGVPTGTASCAGQAFCVGAGYSNIRLVAPSSGPFARFALIGPTSPSATSGALLQQGASGSRISGLFYFPNGPFAMSGGASASNVAGGCFQLVAHRITLSGGATAASECIAPEGGAAGQVRLLR